MPMAIINGLTENAVDFIKNGLVSVLVVFVFLFVRQAWKWSIKKYVHYPVRKEAEMNREIYTSLVELRALVEADRAYIFRFHNGIEFLPGDPAWKMSCTHEVVKHGVTYESAGLQGIFVSLVPNIIEPILAGTSLSEGINVSECKDCPFKMKCLNENKRVVIINTEDMTASFCRFHLEGQNIKTVVMCGIARGGNVCGFVGIDFCGVRLSEDRLMDVVRKVCQTTDKIQFLLRYGKAPEDLPMPEEPITSVTK